MLIYVNGGGDNCEFVVTVPKRPDRLATSFWIYFLKECCGYHVYDVGRSFLSSCKEEFLEPGEWDALMARLVEFDPIVGRSEAERFIRSRGPETFRYQRMVPLSDPSHPLFHFTT